MISPLAPYFKAAEGTQQRTLNQAGPRYKVRGPCAPTNYFNALSSIWFGIENQSCPHCVRRAIVGRPVIPRVLGAPAAASR